MHILKFLLPNFGVPAFRISMFLKFQLFEFQLFGFGSLGVTSIISIIQLWARVIWQIGFDFLV